MLVIGNKEIENNTVAPRMRNGKNLGAIPLDDFINHLNQECKQELQMQSN
jgi:threonyl-tRNA synthetase